MVYYPIILIALIAIVNWLSVWKKWRIVEYVTKPATMLALLLWIWQSVGLDGLMIWFTVGIFFCLVGDVLLMIPRDMFIFGLIAFLVGQVCYVIGLNNLPPYINLWDGGVIIVLLIYIGWLYPKLVVGLKAKGKTKLKIPVLIYSLVISLMVYSALMAFTRTGWRIGAAIAVSLGAILFYISDSILAWDRFINPIPNGRVLNMVAYHLGQFGIVLGAMLHLSS